MTALFDTLPEGHPLRDTHLDLPLCRWGWSADRSPSVGLIDTGMRPEVVTGLMCQACDDRMQMTLDLDGRWSP